MILSRKSLFVLALLFTASGSYAQQASWIWYPGDFDIWLGNKMQNRRTERGSFLPPFWKLDAHYNLMDFHKDVNLGAPETVQLFVEGEYVAKLDGKALEGHPTKIEVPAGPHRISLKVFNQTNTPSIFVHGRTVVSDSTWLLTFEDKEWIDASGKVSDKSGTTWLPAATYHFNNPLRPPSTYALNTKLVPAVAKSTEGKGMLYDFGRESFGYLKLEGLKGTGRVSVYFGESKEEALSTEFCETLDRINIDNNSPKDSVLLLSKALRYAYVVPEGSTSVNNASLVFEEAPVTEKGSFKCNDAEINRIYDVAKYTFHLNTREFFIDGIKRDRWIWSGDALQSYLMNFYLYNDNPTVERTLWALRGKDPVTSHINTIMDYSMYWFLGIYDYYLYSGNKEFIGNIYPRMKSLMDYCLSRRNSQGYMEGLAGDWVFIDWADGLSKQGAVSFEQLLLARSLETMAICAELANRPADRELYAREAQQLKTKLLGDYWNPQKQALVHSLVNGSQTDNVTRYANMFAIFFNYFTPEQKQAVKKSVLLNDNIQKIVTPYMRFYELEALCAMDEQKYVLGQMKDYWGGMLKLGATSFWEEYNPAKSGTEHLAMYGRPFGKSLCHAWGASPIYLLGRYYLGVEPQSAGYASYTVKPVLGGLQWMEGRVPTPSGTIDVFCDKKSIKLHSQSGQGLLEFVSTKKPKSSAGTIRSLGGNRYSLELEPGVNYNIEYRSAE